MTEQDWVIVVFGSLGVLIGLLLFYNFFRTLSLRRAMSDTPTSKIRSAPMGKVELKGLGKAWETELQAPFSEKECVWFRWKAEEERTEYQNGKRRSRWVEMASGESFRPFLLEDSTGSIKVDPSGADIRAPKLLSYTSGGLFSSKARPSGAAARSYLASSNRIRLSEWRLGISLPLYVLGTHQSLRQENGASENLVGINPKGHRDHTLISYKTEKEMQRSEFWKASASLVFGIALCAGSLGYLAKHFLHTDNIKLFQRETPAVAGREPLQALPAATIAPTPEMIGY